MNYIDFFPHPLKRDIFPIHLYISLFILDFKRVIIFELNESTFNLKKAHFRLILKYLEIGFRKN